MNEAEAEATLRVLAEPMVWGATDTSAGSEPYTFHCLVGGVLYVVQTYPGEEGPWEAQRAARKGVRESITCGVTFARRAEAQAACERHHTTGSWN